MSNKGSGIISISLKYFRHLLQSGYRNGHGVHSPFVYTFVRDIIFNKQGNNVPEKIISKHVAIRKSRDIIEVFQGGAESRVSSAEKRSIASVARKSSISFRQAALLYRIVHWYKPTLVIEYGTGIGISTMYLHAAAPETKLITLEGSDSKVKMAKTNNCFASASSIHYLIGDFKNFSDMLISESKDHMMVFIDGDHRYFPTVDKVNKYLEMDHLKEAIIIIDDIYWSHDMERAWKHCLLNVHVDISLDLFYFGILLKRPGIARQHFKVKF